MIERFRYVPRIIEAAIGLDRRLVARLEERDRALEDYLGRLTGTVPGPATTVVTETAFGQLSAVGTDLLFARAGHTHGTPNPHACYLTHGANQTIADATETPVSLANATYDPFGLKSGSGILIQQSGLYTVSMGHFWDTTNSTGGNGGVRVAHLKVNGGVFMDDHVSANRPDNLGNAGMNGPGSYPSRLLFLNAGVTVTMTVLQQAHPASTAGSLALLATNYSPLLAVVQHL